MPSRGLWEHSQAPLERFMGPRASQVELHGGPWFVDGTLSTGSDSSKVVILHGIYMVFALSVFWRFTDSIFYEFCMLT